MLTEFNCCQFTLNLWKVVPKINSHEVSKFKFSTKTLQNMQKLFSFSMQMQYDIIKLNTGSIIFSDRSIKVEKKKRKLKKKMKEKK